MATHKKRGRQVGRRDLRWEASSRWRRLLMPGAPYSTDLTDREWAVLRPLLPPAKPGGRPRSSDVRQILNAIFFVVRSGCPWRLLPRDFPPWPTVDDSFRKGHNAGVWEPLNAT